MNMLLLAMVSLGKPHLSCIESKDKIAIFNGLSWLVMLLRKHVVVHPAPNKPKYLVACISLPFHSEKYHFHRTLSPTPSLIRRSYVLTYVRACLRPCCSTGELSRSVQCLSRVSPSSSFFYG